MILIKELINYTSIIRAIFFLATKYRTYILIMSAQVALKKLHYIFALRIINCVPAREMKIIINVMLLLPKEKNILSHSADRFTEGNGEKGSWRREVCFPRIECIEIINYKIRGERSVREQSSGGSAAMQKYERTSSRVSVRVVVPPPPHLARNSSCFHSLS